MKTHRVVAFGTGLLEAPRREAAQPKFCRNCGDPFDADAENAAVRQPHGKWRPCPNPSPGKPLLDCGIGGHMYTDEKPEVD